MRGRLRRSGTCQCLSGLPHTILQTLAGNTFFTTKHTGIDMGSATVSPLSKPTAGSFRATNNSALGEAYFSFDLLTRRIQ